MQAWSLYSVGQFEESAQMAAPLLELRTDSKVKGDAFYLAGKLGERNNRADVMDLYSQAIEIYATLGALNSAFLAYVSTANFLVTRDDLDLAKNYIDLAKDLSATNPNLGFLAEVESKLYFRQGNFQKALQESRRGLSFFKGRDLSNYAQLMSLVGLFQILNGELDEGLSQALECENIIREKALHDQYFFNQIVIFLYHRCNGLQGLPYFDSISGHVEKSGDRNLKWYLDFAINFDCSHVSLGFDPEPESFQAIEGEGPPPPPDNQ